MDVAAIDSLDDLVEAIDVLERLHARVALAAAQLADRGNWAADGSLSMAAWLARNARMSHRDAHRLLRRGRFLRDFDDVRAAALDRRLPSSHVEALLAVVREPLREVFASTQHGTVDALAPLEARDAELACVAWKQRAEAVAEIPEPAAPDRELRVSTAADGSVVARLTLDAEGAVQLQQAIGTATHLDEVGDGRSPSRRRADALVEVLTFFNANHHASGTPRHRPHVELHIQQSDLRSVGGACAVTEQGRLLPSSATDAFLCDCVIHRVLRAGAALLDYGRETRVVPPALVRAVHARDVHCRFPGCDRPGAWCDVHHVRAWVAGGPTALPNLLLLCNRHHHLVHRDRWTIRLDGDASVTFTRRDGRTFTQPAPERFHRGPPIATGPPPDHHVAA